MDTYCTIGAAYRDGKLLFYRKDKSVDNKAVPDLTWKGTDIDDKKIHYELQDNILREISSYAGKDTITLENNNQNIQNKSIVKVLLFCTKTYEVYH